MFFPMDFLFFFGILQATPTEIKKVFSAVGFVWDVFVPKNFETGYVLTRLSKFWIKNKSMYIILISWNILAGYQRVLHLSNSRVRKMQKK